MTELAFLRSPEAQALLARAARASGMPLSIHFLNGEEESPRTLSFGQCAICKWVSKQPGGREACVKSRVAASSAALRRRTPVPFLCHMGLACVSAPALPDTDCGFALTLGPFHPSRIPEALESAVRNGLENLETEPPPDLDSYLSDVPIASTDVAPELAEWVAADLFALWEKATREADREFSSAPEGATPGLRKSIRPRRDQRPDVSGFPASTVAALLGGKRRTHARALIRAALETVSGQKKVRSRVKRVRAVALAAAALEAAERAGMDTSSCWHRFSAFVEQVRVLAEDDELEAIIIALLQPLRRRNVGSSGDGLVAINRAILERLPEQPKLVDVARQVKLHPTAITHRLQRKLGLSYSQYVGRLRVERSKQLLLTTKLAVGEVGRRVGIEDAGNFSKLFRLFEGISPRQYRKRHK
ncbi:MAG: helix-turn-helix domain-containing protein [Candidatus Hydrogenedentes bacterium]|nr:helix-turn-helix domain-containing protein [Candidatus Hydrogenedentota bacterium]